MAAPSPLQRSWKAWWVAGVSERENRCLQKLKLLLEDTAVFLVTIFSIPMSLVPEVKREGGFPELPSVAF